MMICRRPRVATGKTLHVGFEDYKKKKEGSAM